MLKLDTLCPTRRIPPGLYKSLIHAYRRGSSFIPVFAMPVAGVHGVPFGGARFVNDPLEQAADRGIGQRTEIIALGVLQHFLLAVRLVQRNFRFLLELADFNRELR